MRALNLMHMDIEALSGSILFAGAAFLAIIFIVMSLILNHHWNKYGYDHAAVSQAKKVYYIGSVLILGVALFSALYYTIQ
jgi:hypothetical protein